MKNGMAWPHNPGQESPIIYKRLHGAGGSVGATQLSMLQRHEQRRLMVRG